MSLCIFDISDKRGASYVMVMFAIVVLGTISFSFISLAALETEAAANYKRSAGARYAARAGVNTAVWRIMNEPNFANNFDGVPISDTFQGLPIQYMVEKAANNESILVTSTAANGSAASTLRHLIIPPVGGAANSTSMIAYGEGTQLNPRYRTWDGASWSAEAMANPVDSRINWIVLRGCPTREEKILGALDESKRINVQVWDGSTWGPVTLLSTDVEKDFRCFDVAYESVSGEALVTYGKNQDKGKLFYRTWDGSTWSSEAVLSLPIGDKIRWVSMARNPNSDEIVVAILDKKKDIAVSVWNGSAFANTMTVETDAAQDKKMCMDVAYESSSGRAMVIWARKNKKSAYHRTWDGSTWSAEAKDPDFGKKLVWLRLASDPSSNRILLGALVEKKRVDVAIWDGTSWGGAFKVEKDAQTQDSRCFDVAFESSGNQAIVAWADKNVQSVVYRVWSSGAWSSEFTGPNTGDKMAIVQLMPDPGSDEMFMSTLTIGKILHATQWDGSSWGLPQEIETDNSGSKKIAKESFMVAF